MTMTLSDEASSSLVYDASKSDAEGYYIVKSNVDVKEGDQITFMNKTYTVIKVKDNWIWNRIENYTVAVK